MRLFISRLYNMTLTVTRINLKPIYLFLIYDVHNNFSTRILKIVLSNTKK